MVQLESLLRQVTKRENIISDVTERLESELDVLSEFLDNVARRRPKGIVTLIHSQKKEIYI